jgi:hypothetical protein
MYLAQNISSLEQLPVRWSRCVTPDEASRRFAGAHSWAHPHKSRAPEPGWREVVSAVKYHLTIMTFYAYNIMNGIRTIVMFLYGCFPNTEVRPRLVFQLAFQNHHFLELWLLARQSGVGKSSRRAGCRDSGNIRRVVLLKPIPMEGMEDRRTPKTLGGGHSVY